MEVYFIYGKMLDIIINDILKFVEIFSIED